MQRKEKVPVDALEREVEAARRGLEQAGTEPSPAKRTEIDGAPAFAIEYAAAGRRARRLMVQHANRLYAVTLESTSRRFAADAEVLDAYLRSWHWGF